MSQERRSPMCASARAAAWACGPPTPARPTPWASRWAASVTPIRRSPCSRRAGTSSIFRCPAAAARRPRRSARVTVGKIDLFGFFDGNTIADDETTRFQNNAFVHNPLLDSGGGIGADAYGFAPGAILQYIDERDKSAAWTYSLGVFGAGQGANFSGSMGKPLAIAQIETTRRIGFLPGTYRLYAWTNGQAAGYLGQAQRQQGVGLSIDQQVSDELTVFARWGRLTKGQPRFDTALTADAELSGNVWAGGGDAFGVAWGRLRTAKAFGAESAMVDADGDGQPDWGYGASGAETLAELYYRWSLGNGLQLTPSVQWIRRPGGDGAASAIRVLGVRAQWAF